MNSRNKSGDPKKDPLIEETDKAAQDSATLSETLADETPGDMESTLILDQDGPSDPPQEVIEDAELVEDLPDARSADLMPAEVTDDVVAEDSIPLAEIADRTIPDDLAPSDVPPQDEDPSEVWPDDTVAGEPTPEEPASAPEPDAIEEAAATMAAAEAPFTAQVAPPPPSAPPAEKKSGGGFVPAVLGGLIAAGLGYGIATYTNLTGAGSEEVKSALSDQGSQLTSLETRIGEIAASVSKPNTGGLEDQLTALTGQLQTRFDSMATQFDSVAKTIGDVQSKLSELDGRVGGLDSQIGDVGTKLGAVNDRLTAVEKRPLVESSETAKAAFTAYERELQDLKTTLDQQKAESEKAAAALAASAESAASEMKQVEDRAAELQAEAEATAKAAAEKAAATAKAAALREALATLTAAIERGAPFTGAIATLSDGATVPEALTANAATGVVSLSALQDSFPDAERAALDASIKATIGDDPVDRLGAFLRTQTGARSLVPKEGDDPDAVLSRADADVMAGDLAGALSEIGQLPQAGQDVLAEWVARARTRLAVTTAADDLAKTLLAN